MKEIPCWWHIIDLVVNIRNPLPGACSSYGKLVARRFHLCPGLNSSAKFTIFRDSRNFRSFNLLGPSTKPFALISFLFSQFSYFLWFCCLLLFRMTVFFRLIEFSYFFFCIFVAEFNPGHISTFLQFFLNLFVRKFENQVWGSKYTIHALL